MTCEKCGAETHRDDAMDRRCNSCEHLVSQCNCGPRGLKTVTLARRTFYTEAIQVGPHNEAAVAEWCGGEIHATSPERGLRRYIKVSVPGAKSKNQTMAFHGDWVLFNGKGFKVYTTEALWRDFNISPEKPCDETRYTADGRPCVLGAGHRRTATPVACRSFQDYLVVDKNQLV